jgi:hypothetical protein
MDTSALLVLFLAFGAACSSVWAFRLSKGAEQGQ